MAAVAPIGMSASHRHHYVPQFYLRQFAAKDPNKVFVLERHGDMIVGDLKSIDRIGYEDRLHDYSAGGIDHSIESLINSAIETPFTESETWTKISEGAFDRLSTADGIPLYLFGRHLQRRNLETLRFIETEHARVMAEGFPADYDDDERAMHSWIAADPDNASALFREAALAMLPPADPGSLAVMLCRSPMRLRTSTNPMLVTSTPGVPSAFGAMFGGLQSWWLPLDPFWGLFLIQGGEPGFSTGDMPADAVNLLNQLFLVQLHRGLSVRYLLADDRELDADLDWAGYDFAQRTTHGFRYRKRA